MNDAAHPQSDDAAHPQSLDQWLDRYPDLSDEELASRIAEAIVAGTAPPELLDKAIAFWIDQHQTAEDHHRRAAHLQRKNAELEKETAERHEDAARFIGSTGVRGLDDLPELVRDEYVRKFKEAERLMLSRRKTAERHGEAARLIESAGVRCLADLPELVQDEYVLKFFEEADE